MSMCMIAMRTLSTMYFAAGWIRNMFQKLNESRGGTPYKPRPTSSQAATPTVAASSDGTSSTYMPRQDERDGIMEASPNATSIPTSEAFQDGSTSHPGYHNHHHAHHPHHHHHNYSNNNNHYMQQQQRAFIQPEAWINAPGNTLSLVPVNRHNFTHGISGPVGGVFDYPMVDTPGFTDIDLADRWQDLLNENDPLLNPFL